MQDLSRKAIESVQKSEQAYCKFITDNDVGGTGGHQSGYHIHKNAWPLIFDQAGTKGSNKDLFATIKWQGDFETKSRFIYYGVGTRDEYRLTRFQRGFPYLDDENIGDLLVLSKQGKEHYDAFVLSSDVEIEEFFSAFGISSAESNRLIDRKLASTAKDRLFECFVGFIKSVKTEFPPTKELSENARDCYNASFGISSEEIIKNPDRELLNWLDAEFQLFKAFENDRYGKLIQTPFKSVEDFVKCANTILQRRKSRAGHSLEHHLCELFDLSGIKYSSQSKTEESKTPDFLFPGNNEYHDPKFDSKRLVFLASKTTCKDRWRQILNEADRIKTKHLFTLQQGISRNQLSEMYKSHVRLVVPKPYLKSFPEEFRDRILTLESFLPFLSATQ